MGSQTRTYKVAGMSCGHCRASVSEELTELDGVERVTVDLESGRVDVSGTEIDDDRVAVAVEAAGYRVVGGR